MLRPSRSDLYTLLAYWLLAAPFILSGYLRDYSLARSLVALTFTIVLDTSTVLALVYGLLPNLLQLRRRALLLVPVFLLASGLLYTVGYGVVLGDGPRLGIVPVLYAIFKHAISYGLLAMALSVKRYFELQRRLVLAQQAQTESELRSLRAQFDPHFLFNNLNVLRGLIQQDPAEAIEFLNRFASLYRLLIRHQQADCVTLAEEMQFADEYAYLLGHRFGSAYAFAQALPPPAEQQRLLIVPGTVQQLLENVVKHNAGDEDEPLLIRIEATATALTVRHARRPKRTPVESTGQGLRNLRECYQLLFGREIVVLDDGQTFAVTVPLLPQARPAPAAPRPTIAITPAL